MRVDSTGDGGAWRGRPRVVLRLPIEEATRMPLYEYQCEDCRTSFTLLQSVHTKPGETVCPNCGGRRNRRLLSSFASKVQGGGEAGPAAGGCAPSGCGCH
jgi:putative FmdB family regulatory protein